MRNFGKLAFVSMMTFAGAAMAGDAAKPASPPADAKPMEMPKPAAQIGERAKSMAGTWKCDGSAPGMDGKDQKFTGTMTSKADLDGYWVHDSFNGNMGEGKTAMKFKFEMFATFDANAKKWRSVMVDNWGGQVIGMGDEMKDGKMDTVSDSMDMMGKGQMKDHTDISDAKKGAHMWGEMSRDGGKTWKKSYDMTCKK
jgi:hypothetical protein